MKRFNPKRYAQRVKSQKNLSNPNLDAAFRAGEIDTFQELVDYFLHGAYSTLRDARSSDLVRKFEQPHTSDTYIVLEKGLRTQKTGYLRSLDDIFRLCRNYFPEVKMHEVLTYLNRNYNSSYCPTVCKVVYSSGKNGNIYVRPNLTYKEQLLREIDE